MAKGLCLLLRRDVFLERNGKPTFDFVFQETAEKLLVVRPLPSHGAPAFISLDLHPRSVERVEGSGEVDVDNLAAGRREALRSVLDSLNRLRKSLLP
jgi:hypothetical protein